jgi:hypothetical protein
MNFVYSQHAQEQIELRGLDKSIVDDVLNSPSAIVNQDNLITIFLKIFLEGDKLYLYRIFVNCIKDPPLVVTAYKTSKTDKYENQV